ncbi:MAG: peptide chain release factor N(5)-glutamine methyltransferase, partial [bacterium]|nr:peptide chain release factor N(5)-glutamine methyltransferase [bacterium]
MIYSNLFSNSLALFKAGDKAFDIQLLMEAAFKLTREQFWIKKDETITDDSALRTFYRHRSRLLQNEPVAYILKEKEFYGEVFYVNRNVLIPRPETEILVERAGSFAQDASDILDIGAGSGIISIMLAKQWGAVVTAIENSKEAVYVLKKNIALHGVGERVIIECADLFPPLGRRFDMIVSNPPYIPEGEWRGLDPWVRDYEPKAALAAGYDGLDIIRRIIKDAGSYLKP